MDILQRVSRSIILKCQNIVVSTYTRNYTIIDGCVLYIESRGNCLERRKYSKYFFTQFKVISGFAYKSISLFYVTILCHHFISLFMSPFYVTIFIKIIKMMAFSSTEVRSSMSGSLNASCPADFRSGSSLRVRLFLDIVVQNQNINHGETYLPRSSTVKQNPSNR